MDTHNIKRYLDISTAHVPHDEWERMHGVEGVIMTDHEYGRWVWVIDDLDAASVVEECPVLGKVMAYAAMNDCTWINFDRDAAAIADLPFFDW